MKELGELSDRLVCRTLAFGLHEFLHERDTDPLVDIQRQLARKQSLLIDGRDIGTVVLPEADVKIFLTASPEARALRRYTQIISSGKKSDYPTVLQELIKRDSQDTSRKHDPLRPAEDAVVLDTSALSFEETLSKLLELVEAKRDKKT